jgi:exosome complex exonuclease RRP6
VIHGSDRDIVWLQKDLGLYVVNMFDTGRAAEILGMPRGLAKLLWEFCQVQVRLLSP